MAHLTRLLAISLSIGDKETAANVSNNLFAVACEQHSKYERSRRIDKIELTLKINTGCLITNFDVFHRW